MKCAECGHRNRAEDNFCMICASPLTPTPPSKSRVALPPQNVLDGLEGRMVMRVAKTQSSTPLWAWWTTALLTITIAVAVYLLYFVDTYKVEAIDYSPGTNDQTGSISPDL